MPLRVALVTTDPAALPCPDLDTEPLLAALRDRGVEAEAPRWRDASVDWDAYDLLVIRSPWDYPDHPGEWRSWLDARDPGRLANSAATIRWNFDKRYLLELERHGLPIVPTTVCGTVEEVQAACAACDCPRVVIKPNVSAASRHTHLMETSDPHLLTLAQEILDVDKLVLVEPAVPELACPGEPAEHAVFVIDGQVSHAARKGPLLALGGGLRGGTYAENMESVQATAGEVALAERAVAEIADILGERPLYARIDLVTTQAWGPVIIEAELFEPQYFFRLADGAVDRVADAVAARARTVAQHH